MEPIHAAVSIKLKQQTMNKQLEKIKNFRLFVLNQISGLTSEQLNFIPQGYNNNIIWNVGHLVAATQAICYKRAGLPVTIDDKYFIPFLPTTKPDHFINNEEIEAIKALFISTMDTLQTDYANKLFDNYTRSERIKEVYAIDVSNIDDAIDFLLFHEGFHSGYITALIHLV